MTESRPGWEPLAERSRMNYSNIRERSSEYAADTEKEEQRRDKF